MNNEKTLESNKLIAEFMGYKLITPEMRKTPSNWKYSFWENPEFKGSSKGVLCMEKYLSYHYSWDWLMPVVEKIENFNHSSTLFIIEDERCHVNSQNGFEIDSIGHTKIEAIYNAVIEFIKWHNQNKLNETN